MSDNKGTYVFDHRLLNKRLDELRDTPVGPENKPIIKGLIELSDQLAAMAGALMLREAETPTYTDEEVRELVRHLKAVIKQYESETPWFEEKHFGEPVQDALRFLRSKNYFNLNQSDLV